MLSIKLMTYEDSHLKKENSAKHEMLVSGKLIFEQNVESLKLYSLIKIKYLTFWLISSATKILNMCRLCPGFKLFKKINK